MSSPRKTIQPTGDPDTLVIDQGMVALTLLKQFCEAHNHTVIALKSDYLESIFLMRNDDIKMMPAMMLKTGDRIAMREEWDSYEQKNNWKAYIS